MTDDTDARFAELMRILIEDIRRMPTDDRAPLPVAEKIFWFFIQVQKEKP